MTGRSTFQLGSLHSEDAGEEQQQQWQVACRLWALFAVLAGAVERTGPAVEVFVEVVATFQLIGLFAGTECC